MLTPIQRRTKIKYKIRKTVKGTEKCPRLTVYRSNKETYAQLIDDVAGKTIVAATSLKKNASKRISGTDQAKLVGKEISEKAVSAGISEIVFDRNGYLYHGCIKALADAAREGGLKF